MLGTNSSYDCKTKDDILLKACISPSVSLVFVRKNKIESMDASNKIEKKNYYTVRTGPKYN